MNSRRFTTIVYAHRIGTRSGSGFRLPALSADLTRNSAFQGVQNAQKPYGKAFLSENAKKTPQKHSFLCFFPLQAVPLSRIIGLTKEEIEHFRIVLFFMPSGFKRANERFSSHIKQKI
jgi:hypothetical protein